MPEFITSFELDISGDVVGVSSSLMSVRGSDAGAKA